MDLNNFIKTNKIDYTSLKDYLESEPYNLKFKEDIDYPNLSLIYNTEKSNFNLKIVNECNGLIIDKNNLNIVCYTFDKCNNSEVIPDNLDKDNLYMECAVEGALIRLYYNYGKWIFSTKKCIDASKSKWLSEKHFIDLFFDCIGDYDIFQKLDINCCYSFLIMHPENNIIQNINPFLYHINTRDMTTLQELINDYVGINRLDRIKIQKEELDNQIYNIINNPYLVHEGLIFIDDKFNRWKIKSNIYKRARLLWGNTNNRFYRYLELRKDINLLNEYLKYFPNDKNKFIKYEIEINDFGNIVLEMYISKHVKKEINLIPYYFSKLIYKLHGIYLKDKIKTNHDKIMLLLLELEPKKLCFIINCYNKYYLNKEKDKENNNEQYNENNIEYDTKMDID
jgi:hypothetical protein